MSKLTRRVADDLFAGLLALLPLIVTWLVVRFAFRTARDGSLWAIDLLLSAAWSRSLLTALGVPLDLATGVAALPLGLEVAVSVFAAALTLAIVVAAGELSRRVVGRRVLEAAARTVGSMPGIGAIYRTTTRVAAALGGQARPVFEQPVRVPFLVPGVDAIGFVTQAGPDASAVFVPTAPNPTTGFVLLVPNDRLHALDIPAEEALSAVVSAGVLLPAPMLAGARDEP